MTEAEWEEAWRYLIGQVRKIGGSTMAEEIERGSSTMVSVPAEEIAQEAALSKSDRREMGEFSIRPRRPRERFDLAVGILRAWLVEHPAQVRRARRLLLETGGKRIRIAPDAASEVPTGGDVAKSLESEMPGISDQRELRKLLARLTTLMAEKIERDDGVA